MKIFKNSKMSDYIPGGVIEGKLTLEAEAELLFPYPMGACAYVKMKINWRRERWVKENLNGINVNS